MSASGHRLCHTTCTTNEECGAGEACTDGACERTFECTITTDPQTGETSDNCLAYEECRAVSEDNTTVGQCVFQAGCRSREACFFEEDAEPGAPGACVFVECTTNDDCFFFEPACVQFTCANVQWTQTVQTREMSAWIIAVLTTLNVD